MERKIKDLSPGQSAWTPPWALHTAQGRQWLRPNYPAYSSPSGTAQMKVTALAPKGKSKKRRYHAQGATVELAPFGGPEGKAMAGIRQKCAGCDGLIEVVRVNPGEDESATWRITWYPAGEEHVVVHEYSSRAIISCPNGVVFAVALPRRESESGADKDVVDHETWLEYHDRLVREYFDGERELLKEIYPKKETPAPRRVRRPRLHPLHGSAAAFLGVAVLNYTLNNTVTMIIWFAGALLMFMAAAFASRR
jgi:hypothetical protein